MKATRANQTYQIAVGGLLLALGVFFPQFFHVFGPQAGRMFLPMHIPVLLAGLFLGPEIGFVVGAASPLLSWMYTGGTMPPSQTVVFMVFELLTYGLTAGLFYRKLHLNLYVSLIAAMLCGRAVYALSLFVAGTLLGVTKMGVYAVVDAAVAGLPGIALQLIAVPPLVVALKKGGMLSERIAARKENAQ